MHGDKLEIAGQELLFSDDAKTGATTRSCRRAEIAAIAASSGQAARRARRRATGGRLVSLVDGKEYLGARTA